jgi:polar amino acid transport system substrate-binding protein
MARRLLAAALALAAGACLAGPPAPASAASQAAPGLDCTRPLTLGLHEHGLLYTSRTGEGIDKDIADEMARRSGCKLTLTVMPRARIWQLVESGALDFTLSGIADAQREQFASFAWYEANRYYLLVRKDADVRTVADFKRRPGLKLGVIRGFRYSASANALADALDDDQRLTYATALEPLYDILQDNRIQAMIIEPFDYPAIDTAQWRALTTVLEFDDPAVMHGLVISKRSLAPAQREAWRELIRAMRADGTVRRIFEKYFPADLARTMTQF